MFNLNSLYPLLKCDRSESPRSDVLFLVDNDIVNGAPVYRMKIKGVKTRSEGFSIPTASLSASWMVDMARSTRARESRSVGIQST